MVKDEPRGWPYLGTIVVPCHNERAGLVALCECLLSVLPASDFCVLLVDDGSSDGSYQLMRRLADQHTRICALQLAKRYGQAAALVAGFRHCKTRYALSFDADLEYEPECLLQILERLRSGFPIVNGSRTPRVHNIVHRFGQRLAHTITKRRYQDPFCPVKGVDLHLLEQFQANDAILNFPGLAILSLDREVAEVPVVRGERRRGESRYGFLRLARLLIQLTVLAIGGYLPPLVYEIKHVSKPPESVGDECRS